MGPVEGAGGVVVAARLEGALRGAAEGAVCACSMGEHLQRHRHCILKRS